ncbi:MAG TPA: peptide chain release factor N(5)-glutamine methyltransferase [Patescibacteria group bacterium]|jgi:release factor glutamine methyltransferase|nr:peptide chain release factor N(5)-glutamine methyltransferase [Patescibacteria group bacterium]
MTIRAALDEATATLRAAGVETPRVDAEWLLADLLPGGRRDVVLGLDRALDAGLAARYRGVVHRRAAREPLQLIRGWQDFLDVRVGLAAGVLVPRPETETLAEWALELLPPADPGRRPLVVDVGTGSGCIAAAIAHAREDVRVLAIELDAATAGVARFNVARLGLGDRVSVVAADALTTVAEGAVDLIVSNPPYLPTDLLPGLPPEVSAHEPALALDGGRDGLVVIRRLIEEAPRRLRPGGVLVLETAGDLQVRRASTLMRTAGLIGVATRRDLTGIERFVAGTSPAISHQEER